tara:strand:- start:1080 stop:1280 length:201 start_codon:yes stop_codon:yes gene_type:complete
LDILPERWIFVGFPGFLIAFLVEKAAGLRLPATDSFLLKALARFLSALDLLIFASSFSGNQVDLSL